MRGLSRHLFSTLTSLWVIANLAFWMIPLGLLSLGRVLLPGLRSMWFKGTTRCYHAAVAMNSFWMLQVVRIRIDIDGSIGDHPAPIILANHQSWFDIPILHHVVTDHGPILKFLIKRQLVWVPVVGWLCWMLGFPKLYRGGGDAARQRDYTTLRRFADGAAEESGGILIFPEGTRFTDAKREEQQSPFRDLLRPRAGGLRILAEAFPPDTPVVDITIVYRGGRRSFWDCLHGAVNEFDVTLGHTRLGDIDDPTEWLNQQWRHKQELMASGYPGSP